MTDNEEIIKLLREINTKMTAITNFEYKIWQDTQELRRAGKR